METQDAAPSQPQEVAMMQELIKSMGIDEYEPRVVNQLMDFMHKYVSEILQDAEYMSENMGKPAGHLDLNAVMLAVQSRNLVHLVSPPSQDDQRLGYIAAEFNKTPLGEVVVKPGLALPAEQHQMTAPNLHYDPYGQYKAKADNVAGTL